MALNLTTYEAVASFLSLKQASTSYPELTTIIASLQARFEAYTGVAFEQIERTQTGLLSVNQTKILLDSLPIVEVSSVSIDDAALTDYFIDENDGCLILKTPYQDSMHYYEIVYTGGLFEDDDAVNSDIKHAALLQAVFEFQNRASVGAEIVKTDGGTVYKKDLDLLSGVRKILYPYRRLSMFISV